MNDFISLDNVTKSYTGADGRALVVLDGVSWTVVRGETVAVTGPSGSGKSTLLNLIGALDKPTSGTVTVGGQRVDELNEPGLADYRARQVGFVFQDHHLLPQLTALENVLLPTLGGAGYQPARRSPATTAGRLIAGPSNGGTTPVATAGRLVAGPSNGPVQYAEDLLRRVGLAERMHSYPAQLSGGERQRVAIARALMNQPPLLLCDEPTGNLDQATGGQVVELLLQLAQDEGLTVVMVTHNPTHAACCGRQFELLEGKLKDARGARSAAPDTPRPED